MRPNPVWVGDSRCRIFRQHAVGQNVAQHAQACGFQRRVERAPDQGLPKLHYGGTRHVPLFQPLCNCRVGLSEACGLLQIGHIGKQFGFECGRYAPGKQHAAQNMQRRGQGRARNCKPPCICQCSGTRKRRHGGLNRWFSSGATRPGMRRAKCAARCPKTETVGISGQCARPSARLPAGFKQGNVGVPRQGDGGGQAGPACADDGDFRARMRRVHHLFLQWLKPRFRGGGGWVFLKGSMRLMPVPACRGAV